MVPATTSNRVEFRRLILQIERDLLSQTRLKTLLAAAVATTVGHREELRAVKGRLARSRKGAIR